MKCSFWSGNNGHFLGGQCRCRWCETMNFARAKKNLVGRPTQKGGKQAKVNDDDASFSTGVTIWQPLLDLRILVLDCIRTNLYDGSWVTILPVLPSRPFCFWSVFLHSCRLKPRRRFKIMDDAPRVLVIKKKTRPTLSRDECPNNIRPQATVSVVKDAIVWLLYLLDSCITLRPTCIGYLIITAEDARLYFNFCFTTFSWQRHRHWRHHWANTVLRVWPAWSISVRPRAFPNSHDGPLPRRNRNIRHEW